jgi:[ribosomal protein S18]-alanine N-acetyltransferase
MIRELAATDESALAAFFAANNLPEVVSNFHPFPLDAATAHRICTAPRKDRYFAHFAGGNIVGLAMLRGWDEGYEIPSFGILVHRAHQGAGIGKSLTEHALTVAREAGTARVRLTVHRDNERAVRLYERVGFHSTEILADGRHVMFAEMSPQP